MSERRSQFSYEDLLACGRGELFGPGNAQLPLPPMLMFDRIVDISETGGANGKGGVRAEFDIKPELWFFGCHFKGDPVMPGCLGLDALWQLTGFFLGWLGLPGRGRALGVGEVKFADQVLPSVHKVVYGVDVKRVFKGKLNLAIADGWLEADGRRIYDVANMRVGLFGAAQSKRRLRACPEGRFWKGMGESHETRRRHRDGDRLFDREQRPGSAREPSLRPIGNFPR